MKDKSTEFKERFLSLIQSFLEHDISAEIFCSNFTSAWILYRDEQEKIKQTWDEPYDQRLVEARLRGELTVEEFDKRYNELWNFTETLEFREMVDSIHSACSAFNPLLENGWEIDENRLKTEVQAHLASYEIRAEETSG